MNKKCNGLASVQCCNFDVKTCKYRTDEDDCYNPEVIMKALEKQMARYTQPKRKPDSNGVLPLTEEELEWFRHTDFLYNSGGLIDCIKIVKNSIVVYFDKVDDGFSIMQEQITNYKATEWLLKKFNLGGE
jgi:hypothetical protein